MAPVQVFLTGATGYIGGDFLHAAYEAHPDWQYVCLVRNKEKGQALTERYNNIRLVHGDLDASDLIEEEAASANIVYNFADCDHEGCANAITKGIKRNKNAKVYWIHTSGTGILTFRNFAEESFGRALKDEKTYDDWDGIKELTSLPDQALHRKVDKIVLAASEGQADHIKTAIVGPPAIFGKARGTGNPKSVQVYMAANLAVKNGKAIQVEDGTSVWYEVHVHDLSKLYLLLGEDAVSDAGRATWNDEGYYFAENGAFTWGDITKAIAVEGKKQGALESDEVTQLSFEEAKKYNEYFPFLCATTSRGVSKRARNLLGWNPTSPRLMDEIPEIVRDEVSAPALEKGAFRAK